MIAIIRIRGEVGVNKNIEETMQRLRLRRKFVCVVFKESPELTGMLKKIGDFAAFGNIDDETYKLLVEKRGEKIKGKLKPFFRLHPPRGGIETKARYPKGVLGNNKEGINELIRRML